LSEDLSALRDERATKALMQGDLDFGWRQRLRPGDRSVAREL